MSNISISPGKNNVGAYIKNLDLNILEAAQIKEIKNIKMVLDQLPAAKAQMKASGASEQDIRNFQSPILKFLDDARREMDSTAGDEAIAAARKELGGMFEEKEEKLFFNSDSDALIAKGLVTLIASIYSDEKAEDIVSNEIDLMEEFELGVILSPARRNGAYSMLKTIKQYAKNLAT